MGASQSTDDHASGSDSAQEVKSSYYTLLNIEKSATDEEIKQAYRRKALSLHPDRNYGREEAATVEFAAVQSAYEVLSDPQERAWYDSHEDAILRDVDPTASARDGGPLYESSIGLTTADDVARLVRKFNGSIKFDDTPSGFFGFLRAFFDQLMKEEERAARTQNEDVENYPTFGHKDDTHETAVKQFYSAWSGFSTIKSFAWRDKYRLSDADDRRGRRFIEKENLKCRKEGIVEFNDAVRGLIAFVRKRDPRYKPNTQSEVERQKALQDASKAQAARMRAANERARQATEDAVPMWARFRNDDDLGNIGAEEGTFDDSSSVEEHFQCVACRKTFKSEKQYEAHEKSNKHRKAIHALRKRLEKEDPVSGTHNSLPADNESQRSSDAEDHGINESSEDEALVGDVGETEKAYTVSDELARATLDDDERATNHDREDSIESSWLLSSTLPRSPSISPPLSTKSNPIEDTGKASKKGKAAQKREKKATKAAEAAEAHGEDMKFTCAVCQAGFPSKTRMHQHIQDFKHAAPPAQGKYGQPAKVRGKKQKDRNI